MHLDPQTRAKLQSSSHDVYLAYARLDVSQQDKFSIRCDALGSQPQELTLAEFIAKLNTPPNELGQSVQFSINGKSCVLTRDRDQPRKFSLQFQPPLPEPAVKSITTYTPDEKLALLASGNWRMQIPQRGAQQQLSIMLPGDANYELGGPGKYALYRSHLLTLYKLYERLNNASEEDLNSFLVAMSTGSGKTFVQALWLLVLDQAEMDGIFALPDHLIEQFKDDMPKLLPKALTDKIQVFRHGQRRELSDELIALRSPERKAARHLLVPQDHVLDYHFTQLRALNPSRTAMVVDEQHLVMAQESRKLKLMALAEKQLCMFLTATPTKQTYDLCGKDPVCIMSSKQKQAEGQGKFPRLATHHARDVRDKAAQEDIALSVTEGIVVSQVDSLVPMATSPVLSMMEDLQHLPVSQIHHSDSARPDQRLADMQWTYQPPQARKMLAILNDTNDLINMHRVVNQDRAKPVHYAYHDGALIDRADAYDILGQANLDGRILSEYEAKKRTKKTEEVAAASSTLAQPVEQRLFSADAVKNLPDQMDCNIFQGMMEYLLSDLTGMSSAEMNAARKNDLEGFKRRVAQAIAQNPTRDVSYYRNKLSYDRDRNPRGIDANGAAQIAPLLAAMESNLRKIELNTPHLFDPAIRNWSLVNQARDEMFATDFDLQNRFLNYAQAHRALYVMHGMEQAETPIKNGKPFWGFQEELVELYTSDGGANPKAKQRPHGAYELLNPSAKEPHYTPKYDEEMNPDIADNYFKLGFVGMYVSNMKTEGFNDRDLHTVLEVVSSEDDPLNDPAKLVQGVGRLRGLDDTQMPYYFMGMQKGCRPGFNLTHLATKDDYYPDYFQAQAHHLDHAIEARGKRLANDVLKWVQQNRSKGLVVDQQRMEQVIYQLVFRSFQDLHDQNNHDIEKSRKLFAQVLAATRKELDVKIKAMENPNAMTAMAKVIGFFLGSMASFQFNKALNDVAQVIGLQSDSPAELKLYHRVLTEMDYQELNSKQSFLSASASITEAKLHRIGEIVIAQATRKNSDKLAKHAQVIIANLGRFLQPKALQEQVLANAQYYHHWPAHIALFGDRLEELSNLSVDADTNPQHADQLRALLTHFFAVVPGVAITENNIDVNLVAKMKTKQAAMQDEMKELLKQGIEAHLIKFVQSKFLPQVDMLFTDDDAKLFKTILSDSENAKQFVLALMQNDGKGQPLDVFKACFQAQFPAVQHIQYISTHVSAVTEQLNVAASRLNVALLGDNADESMDEKSARVNQAVVNPMHEVLPSYLKAASAEALKQKFQANLLPALVKCFTPDTQLEIIRACKQDFNFGQKLLQMAMNPQTQALFAHMGTGDEVAQAQLLASPEMRNMLVQLLAHPPGLTAETLQEKWRDFPTTAAMAVKTVQKEIERLTDPKQDLGGFTGMMAFFGSAVTKFSAKDAMKERIQDNLTRYFSTQFLNDTESLFSPQEHQYLIRILKNPANAKRLAAVMVAKAEAGELKNFDLNVAMALFKQTFASELAGQTISPVSSKFEQGTVEFGDTMEEIVADLDAHLQTPMELIVLQHLRLEPKQEMNQLAQEKLIPLLLKFFPATQHEAIRAACVRYDNWPYLLAKHKAALAALDEEIDLSTLSMQDAQLRDANTKRALASLLNDIPGLEHIVADLNRGILISAVTLREETATVMKARDHLNEIELVQQRMQQFVAGSLLSLFDDVFIPEHARALRALFSQPSHAHAFAKKLLEKIASLEDVSAEELFDCLQEYVNDNQPEIGSLVIVTKAMENATEEMSRIFDAAISQLPINQLLHEHVLPQFTRKETRNYIHFIVGKFSEDELSHYLFSILRAENQIKPLGTQKTDDDLQHQARLVAKQLKRMDELLQKKQYDKFAEEFLAIPDGTINSASELAKKLGDLPLLARMLDLYELQKEMMAAHNYHYQYAPGGKATKPKLLGVLEPGRDRISGDILAYMFINSLIAGTDTSRPVVAELQQADREALQFVRDGTLVILENKIDQNGLSVWLHTQGKALQNGLLGILRAVKNIFTRSNDSDWILEFKEQTPAERLEAAQARAETVAGQLRAVQPLSSAQLADEGPRHAAEEVSTRVLNPARTSFGLFSHPHAPRPALAPAPGPAAASPPSPATPEDPNASG